LGQFSGEDLTVALNHAPILLSITESILLKNNYLVADNTGFQDYELPAFSSHKFWLTQSQINASNHVRMDTDARPFLQSKA